MQRTTPAIVTQHAARRLPRWVLVLLGLAYVLPGWLGREPWRQADLAPFGAMLDLAQHPAHWLHPQVLGEAAQYAGWLPYWLGAGAMWLLPGLPADLAARTPFALLLVLTLACTWYAMYHLVRLPGAQPVAFAFGGEARPVDYARAMADAAFLALLASLGLALLAHESSPSAAQLAFSAVLLYASARLVSPHARGHVFGVAAWWLGSVGLSLSGAPGLSLLLGLGWLTLSASSPTATAHGRRRVFIWLACGLGTLLAGWLAWQLGWAGPSAPEAWQRWTTNADAWHGFARLLTWFTWPVGLLALWTLWRWHRRWSDAHLLLPLWWTALLLGATWWQGGDNRVLLLLLPALACLGAFALPTLSRTVTALIDWFAVLFFTGGALIIWVIYSAMMTGWPAKPAANVAKLAPSFRPEFAWELLLPAALASALWLALVCWRVMRHRPALWKSLMLSASGITLCWLLLLTLWLPLLNHGLGHRSMSERLAAHTPASHCVYVYGLNAEHITGLQFYGGLALQRWQPDAASDEASCPHLVLHSAMVHTLAPAALQGWERQASIARLRDNQERLLLYRRAPPGHALPPAGLPH